ncbi:VOC family protein [Azospirillum sp. ST 5-10]|uniref:VOC family protein n=1 Tax=unclassified Azospirillum TaxID=2630922 RepID=UPI003F4A380F
MIDHLSVPVSDFERSTAFYDAVLATVGYRRVMEFGRGAGYGDGHPHFWINETADLPAAPVAGFHIAFRAPDRAAVDAFHAAALAHGGRDNGAPGLRPLYHPDYYAGFVLDPDGHKLEAVCHTAS